MEEDIRLIKGILNGDVKCFEALINKYEMKILKFIYYKVGQKEVAEDICQEVFITAYNKLNTFKYDYAFSSWLYTIARNKCIDYGRKKGKRKETSLEEVRFMESNSIKPEEAYEYKEMKSLIEEYLNTLGKIDRDIIILRYVNELTFSEIAQVLKIKESKVKNRFYKLKKDFREYRESSIREGSSNEAY